MATPKIYTKTGDKGQTSLATGERVSKASERIESYGTVDEFNAIVGICRTQCAKHETPFFKKLDTWLEAIQNDLFNLGSDLATPVNSRWKNMKLVGETEISVLEKWIDECQQRLSPLREFVLPGGSELNTHLHLARTVCRRAERIVIRFSGIEDINPQIVPYLNRLSDLFFVLARMSVFEIGVSEVKWSQNNGVASFK